MKRNMIAAAAAMAFAAGAAGAADGEDVCVAPGVTVVTDATGDVNVERSPQGAPISFADIESVKMAEQNAADGSLQLVFAIKVSALQSLPPNSAWFTSFKAPDGTFYGARMVTDITGAETYESYTLNTNSAGDTADGRFPLVSTPAEGSFAADGTITVIVPAADIGVTSAEGAAIRQFNAGSLLYVNIDYPVDPPDPPDPLFVPRGAGFVLDPAPGDDLSRKGSYDLAACSGTSKSVVERLGGALNPALLLPLLALAGLRRRKH